MTTITDCLYHSMSCIYFRNNPKATSANFVNKSLFSIQLRTAQHINIIMFSGGDGGEEEDTLGVLLPIYIFNFRIKYFNALRSIRRNTSVAGISQRNVMVKVGLICQMVTNTRGNIDVDCVTVEVFMFSRMVPAIWVNGDAV